MKSSSQILASRNLIVATILLTILFSSCGNEETYDRSLNGTWTRDGNELALFSDSTFYASCEGYCWAMGGKEDRYYLYNDSLNRFDYDGDYVWKISQDGRRLKLTPHRSKVPTRDEFVVGIWDRTGYVPKTSMRINY